MQKVAIFASLTSLLFLFTPAIRGQDAGEVERLRKENELLKKENELLKKEIELSKRDPQAKPNAAKTEEKEPRTEVITAISGGQIKVQLVKCVRGDEPTLVTFTFAIRPVLGNPKGMNLGKFHGLKLTTVDGKALDGKRVKGPANRIMLTKGESTKFEVAYLGVDQGITELGEVSVRFGQALNKYDPITFYRIKIETEK